MSCSGGGRDVTHHRAHAAGVPISFRTAPSSLCQTPSGVSSQGWWSYAVVRSAHCGG